MSYFVTYIRPLRSDDERCTIRAGVHSCTEFERVHPFENMCRRIAVPNDVLVHVGYTAGATKALRRVVDPTIGSRVCVRHALSYVATNCGFVCADERARAVRGKSHGLSELTTEPERNMRLNQPRKILVSVPILP